MPASVRAHLSRTNTSRPYDRRSPTASPIKSLLNSSPPPPSPTEDPGCPTDQPGLPTYAEYKRIESSYLLGLSPRKRDKALITQVMFDKIWDVLHQPDACTIETPQFRFWVRKMFTLSRPESEGDGEWQWQLGAPASPHADWQEEEGDELERAMGIERDADAALLTTAVVLHENRPVAIMEQLYELFCYCHLRAGHGGRDKTCAVIREHYSWVPKELTAQFVKACPTCVLKRSGGADLGIAFQRRVVAGGRGKRRTGTAAAPLPVGWPTTGGPLDPANPQPCGVRERLRRREDTDASSAPSPSHGGSEPKGGPPPEGSRRDSPPGRVPSPIRAYDPTHALGLTSLSPLRFLIDTAKVGASSPEKTGLPSLASALSNESLDDDVRLTRRSLHNSDDDDGACLPPALRPLRLSGPVPSKSEDQDFPIDPVLLSFSYPGLRHSVSPGRLSAVPAGAGTPERGPYDDLLCIHLRCTREGDHPTGMTPPYGLLDSPVTSNKPLLYSSAPSPSRYGPYSYYRDDSFDVGYGFGSPVRSDDGPLTRVRLLPYATDPDSPGRLLEGTLSLSSI